MTFTVDRTDEPTDARAGLGVAAVQLHDASMTIASRVLWDALSLRVQPGEFLAVLGPNGSGKTTLLKVLLGQRTLTGGAAAVAGQPPGGRGHRIGYIPQQRQLDLDLPLRGRDLVGLGLDGHRFGAFRPPARSRERRARVARALDAVGAAGYADQPVGRLSSGEQQRLRVAQALVGEPGLLLCDEPLLSLDLATQRAVTQLIEQRRRDAGTAVLFVTHEVNPVLPYVDRVLYLVDGRFRIGAPAEVITSVVLSRLYRAEIEVVRLGGRLVVVGAEDTGPHHHHPEATR
jgi:zinc/manganese transport system ATP-binding protein